MNGKKLFFIVGALTLVFAACALIGCRAAVDPNDQKVESTAGNKLTKPTNQDTDTSPAVTFENVVWELTKLDNEDQSAGSVYLYLDGTGNKFIIAKKESDGTLKRHLKGAYTVKADSKIELKNEGESSKYEMSYIITGDTLKVTGPLPLEGTKAAAQTELKEKLKDLLK